MATDSFCRNNTMSFSNHHEDQVQNLSNTKQTTLSAFQIYHLILKWQLKASLKRCFCSAWHWPQNSSPYNSFLGRQSAHMLQRSEWKLMSCYLIYRIHRFKNGTAQEFRHAAYCRFIFHSDRGSSNDFFRNFKFVLVPNPAFLGIKNLMNFLTWLIHPILPLWIFHRENLYSVHWLSSWKYQWHRRTLW